MKTVGKCLLILLFGIIYWTLIGAIQKMPASVSMFDPAVIAGVGAWVFVMWSGMILETMIGSWKP